MMKKVASVAAAASLLLASAPALARQTDGAEHPRVKAIMKVMTKKASSSSRSSVSSSDTSKLKAFKKALKNAKVSRRGLGNSKKLTPSEACKGTYGNERAACMKAFNKGGKPQAGWTWSSWPSSSSVSSSSVSSVSSSMSSTSSSMSSSSSSSSVSLSSSSSSN